jgi:hypothetical protein
MISGLDVEDVNARLIDMAANTLLDRAFGTH